MTGRRCSTTLSVENGSMVAFACVFASSVPHAELIRLVAAEQDCCQFFQFAITVDTRGIALEVRAPEDARPIVESMFGVAA